LLIFLKGEKGAQGWRIDARVPYGTQAHEKGRCEMSKTVTLDELRDHLSHAKEKLSREKTDILGLHPLSDKFNREEYAFAYVRAERLGMRAINRRLAEIDWLPMQLDAKKEVLSESRSSMKRWLASAFSAKPDADEFGNDFMHALARCGLQFGWDHAEFIKLAARISNLFRDLSCLIGIVYYCTWLSENRVEEIRLSNPDDVGRTAEEITELMQSPEIYRYLKASEQDDEKKGGRTTARSREIAGRAPEKQPVKKRPSLRVIRNESFLDPFTPDPVPAL
jgi:hypothetical protein